LKINIKIQKLENGKDLPLPTYGTEQSAGMDLYSAVESPVTLKKGEIMIIPCGIAISLPTGFEAQIRPRSGFAAKNGITVLNTPGTIDSDYRGEIRVILINHGSQDFVIDRAMRIAQMVIAKHEVAEFEEVFESLEATSRGESGFGSTGHK
jgi:dUTP pyrophosphatase